ncbi:uncharacterized protein PV07_01501 [Cladophialophora immunda]|uniref:CorA-like transporter domain-containing protein n=1 Tax=Cladophialophora immunda TaxID=569365 RepID=A0A0D2CUB6_9EURO|nr:uncharacterized protein PV07_01501 [Cladophialophora immunda]KIW34743.1 hypothetical protein PV07_01501 [Cladophialophora immunda]
MANTTAQFPCEEYPCGLPASLFEGDREILLATLRAESARLFSGQDNIEVWKSTEVITEPEHDRITLRREAFSWPSFDLNPKFCTYFVHQPSSWGYLQISRATLQRLLYTHEISPVVLEGVFAFGSKITGEDDPYFSLCSWKTKEQPVQNAAGVEKRWSSEICYLLRYYDKHGRSDLKNAWSLRQTMVYQRQSHHEGQSIWLFIQPSQRCKDMLWRAFPKQNHFLSAHLLILRANLSGWRSYLNDTRRSLADYTEKATKSSLEFRDVDYDTGFKDSQRLRELCHNLRVAQTILDSVLDIARTIQKICHEAPSSAASKPNATKELLADVEVEIQRIMGFKRTACALHEQAEGTSQLLLKLLEYRKADLQTAHTVALRNMAQAANDQSNSLRQLTEQTNRDSRSVKILTFVAMMYLPASLIAVSTVLYGPNSRPGHECGSFTATSGGEQFNMDLRVGEHCIDDLHTGSECAVRQHGTLAED